MRPLSSTAAHALIVLLLAGCAADPAPQAAAMDDSADPAGAGCPPRGQARARVMSAADALPGETAVGTAGDLILQNEHAAFVVTEPDKGSTYFHYGGIIADAAAMDGCDVVGRDQLDEVGVVFADVDLTNLAGSEVRAFRGETVEIVADGTDGGPAIVRVTGVDDTYWLVEYTLVVEALDDGGRELSDPYGVEVAIDYILEPDSPVLRADVHVTNVGDDDVELVLANLLSFGGPMDLFGYAPDQVSALGFDLDFGMPWLVATDGQEALAYAIEDGALAYMGISGIEVAVDVSQALGAPMAAAPGETATRSFFLSVGGQGGASATAPLAAANPEPSPGQTYTLATATGRVVGPDGAGVAGARVSIEARAPGAEWGVLDETLAGADGSFTAPTPVFDDAWEWRLVARADGRDASAAVALQPGASDVEVSMWAPGALDYTITDGDGEPAPARLELTRIDDGARTTRWLAADGTTPLPPGAWEYTATRGYEYAPVRGTLTVPDDGSGALDLVMQRVVDTTGFVSVDTHVHSSDSPDSRVAPADVLRLAAAHDLDLVVHTEHEHIVDRSALAAEVGLDPWVRGIIGEEVTAVVPEHLTMFPAEPEGPRGGPVEWYGRDIDTLFAMMRERSGGGVNLLNHPSYLNHIDWDRLVAEPGLDDPTRLGLAPDAALWSWNLDGIEVMNGHRDPFDPSSHRWGDWQSMLNAGHKVVAVGCSDSHRGGDIGYPRTYVPAGSDRAADVTDGEVVEAFREGRAMASTGAFARLQANGVAGLGETLTDTDDTLDLDLHIEALPEIDVTFVSVFVSCDEVLTVAASDPNGVVKLSAALSVPLEAGVDAAVTVAAFGEDRLPEGLPQFNPAGVPRVLTSPIYVDGDGDGVFSGGGGRECAVFLTGPADDGADPE